MRSEGVPRRNSVLRSTGRRWWIVLSIIVLFVAALAAAAREGIERAYLQHVLVGAIGGDVTLGGLHHRGATTVIDGVRIVTPRGTTLTADAVAYRSDGSEWDITPTSLHISVPRTALDGSEGARLRAAAHDLAIGVATVHLRDAGIDVLAADAKAFEIAGIAGDLQLGERPSYELTGTWTDAGTSDRAASAPGAYPLEASMRADDGTLPVQTLHAPALPLGGIGALLGGTGVTFTGGIAHDVRATYDGKLHATMRLTDLSANFGTATVENVGGPLTVVGDGLGSASLTGTYTGSAASLAICGEVHDVRDWLAGSRDLRMLATMIARIGAQPAVHWGNVEMTAPGIVYGQYAMSTKAVPHVVQLIAMDGHEPTLHFDTALADDRVISKGARTSDLALRTNAVAGINGDYFDIGRTYEPQGLLVRSGALVHGPTDREALVFDRSNRPTFARFRLQGAVTDGARSFPLTLYNSWPTRQVALITPAYGALLPAAPGVTFAALDALRDGRYRVTSVAPMTASIPSVLGLGFGPEVKGALPRPGDTLRVRYALDPPAGGAVAGIGSGPLLLKDGAWYEDAHAPAPDERDVQWPVIAVGTFADGTILFAAVDGRHPERSIGMTRPEFAELLRGFGVTDAMALDSGGSVTMVARSPGAHDVTLHNVPSDNSAERYVADALFAYSTAPLGTIVVKPHPFVEPAPALR